MELTELKRIETIETAQPKRTVFSNLLALVNRPMFALSVLIHAGLLSLPIPDKAAPVDEATPKEVSALTDLSQVALAQSPLLEQTPLALPSLAPPGYTSPTVKPTVDTSRAPRPAKKATPTPIATSSPTPKPTLTPTPTPEPTTLAVPPRTTSTPQPLPTPETTPPPPPQQEPEGAVTMTREEMGALFARLRDNLPESESQAVYPGRLDQPGLFFKTTEANKDTATTSACLDAMISCWWQPRKPLNQLLMELKQHELLQNLQFQEIPEGYGGGKLYHLEPTNFYLTLTKPSGIGSDTLVGIWAQNPRN